MIVEKKILNRWKIKAESGDKSAIAEGLRVHKNVITTAFKGLADQEIIDGIEEYFRKKEHESGKH